MKRNIVLMVFLASISCLLAQTTIPGGNLSTDTWDLAGSPYEVTGDITLPDGVTLTIEAGVVVQFEGEYHFTINGTIITQSNEGNEIIFTNADDAADGNGWDGIRFMDPNENSVFNYVIIRNALETANDMSGGGLYIENCDETFNFLTIENCETTKYGGGLYLKNANPVFNTLVIDGCSANYDGGGMFLFNSDPIINQALIINNWADWSGGAIVTFNGSNPIINKTTISENHAIENGPAIASLYNSSIDLVNSIVYYNYFGYSINGFSEIYTNSNGTANAHYSLIRNGTGEEYFNTNCYDTDPLFDMGGVTGFELTEFSPCIDAGDPNQTYYDPDGTRADLGCFYYRQTGIKGQVILGDPVDPDDYEYDSIADIYEHVSIIIYEGFSYDNPVDTIPILENGYFYKEFTESESGNYRIKCIEDLIDHKVSPVNQDVVVVANQLTELNQPFEISEVKPSYVQGSVRVQNIPISNTSVYYSIAITNDADEDNVKYPYPLYDEYGFIYDWQYKVDVPANYAWEITLYLSDHVPFTYLTEPMNPQEYYYAEQVTLTPTPTYGNVFGNITYIQDNDLEPEDSPATIDYTLAEVYWDDNDDVAVHPDADGNYELIDVQSGYRSITVKHPQCATITKEQIYVISENTLENVDFTILPWKVPENYMYSMTGYITASIDESFFEQNESNVIGAFVYDPVEDKTECRGVGVWQNGNHPYWDTELHYPGIAYGTLPGYWYFTLVANQNEGEIVTFKAFDSEMSNPTETTGFYYFDNIGLEFEGDDANGDNPVNIKFGNLTDYTDTSDYIYDLNQNWTWVSFSFDFVDNSIPNSLPSLNQIAEVHWQGQSITYNDDFNEWFPPNEFYDNNSSYKIKLAENPLQMTLEGKKINPVVNVLSLDYDEGTDLYHYWKWIPFYNPICDEIGGEYNSIDIESAILSIKGNVNSVKSQTQSAVNDNGVWIGDLTELEFGKGYLVDITGDCYLTYPNAIAYDVDKALDTYAPTSEAGWELISGNESNMTLMADLGVSDNYEAGIFDADGNCRSIGKYENKFWYFTVLGDVMDETLYVRLYNPKTKTELQSNDVLSYCANTIQGSPENPIVYEFEGIEPATIERVTLDQNYPNPFNPVTKFSYSIPQDANVTLEVYNVKGQLVETLVNETQTANHYDVNWDASEYGTGMYFYQLSIDGKVNQVKKCIMLK